MPISWKNLLHSGEPFCILIVAAGINFLRLIALKHQFYFAIVLIGES
jgi:hypothetical protein